MNEARNDEHNSAETVPGAKDRLRVAAEQFVLKSPSDQEHERRFMARDLAEYEGGR